MRDDDGTCDVCGLEGPQVDLWRVLVPETAGDTVLRPLCPQHAPEAVCSEVAALNFAGEVAGGLRRAGVPGVVLHPIRGAMSGFYGVAVQAGRVRAAFVSARMDTDGRTVRVCLEVCRGPDRLVSQRWHGWDVRMAVAAVYGRVVLASAFAGGGA